MAREIEHKYLVIDDSYKQLCSPALTRHIRQGYLCKAPERTVRVRLCTCGDVKTGFLTVKAINHGDTREEYEYQVPPHDADCMLGLCLPGVIEKTRYIVEWKGHTWEVDLFDSPKPGLCVAEIELEESTHDYPLPPFVGKEVTGNAQYYNSQM